MSSAVSPCRVRSIFRPQRALTLIELLVSIAIIGLLASILLPALSASRHAARDLECRSRTPCSAGAIVPLQNVSIAFNRRLHVRTRFVNNIPVPATAHLTPHILQLPDVPLLLDTDGDAATAMGAMPYYTAPAVLTD